jgi:AraC family transcriptional regulator
MSVIRRLRLPWLTVEYDRVAGFPDGFAVTKRGAVGVAFTGQTDAVWQLGDGPRTQRGYGSSSVFLVGACDLAWNRWMRTSEAVEFWLDGDWIAKTVSVPFAWSSIEPRILVTDPVLVSVASTFRRLILAGEPEELELEQLGALAAARISNVYAGLQGAKPRPILPFEDPLMRRVDEYIAAHLHGPIHLHSLAAEFSISPFHFAKRFKATTGAAPHAYLVARRMDRSMELLRSTSCTIAAAAAAVGYSQAGHFRKHFRAHWGQSPGKLLDR